MMRTDPDVKARALHIMTEHGLAEAHRETGVPKSTLSRWADEDGIEVSEITERSQEKTKARIAALELRRVDLAAGLLDDIGRLRAQMFEPALATHWTNKGEFVSHGLIEPTFADKKAIATSVAIYVDKVQLLLGHATTRTEITYSGESIDDEVARLERELGVKH